MERDKDGFLVAATDEEIENVEKATQVIHAKHKSFVVQRAFFGYGDNGVYLSGYFAPTWEYKNYFAIYHISFDTWKMERADGGRE